MTAQRAAPEAVFVVGLPRSGTTLMRRVLNTHSRIAIAGENNYLGRQLSPRGVRDDVRRLGDLRDDATVREVVTLLYSERFQRGTWLRRREEFWTWVARYLPREELERRVLEGERSERGLFTALLQAHAARRGKPIFGEKTPAHFRWAETLLEWYPRASVVHMLRDPRAVYRSQLKRLARDTTARFYRVLGHVPPLAKAWILVEVAWVWSSAVARHRRLARRYPDRYRLVRFEDLVREPASEIERLCEFLGVEFEPAMLEQKVVSRGDRLGEAGFDAEAADRWRGSLSALETRSLGWLLGRRIEEMGYPR